MSKLTGTLPSQIGWLANTYNITLTNGGVYRGIPTEIGLLPLTHLNLEDNDFSSLPTELGNIAALHNVILSDNSFSIAIPTELGNVAQGNR